MSPTTSYNTEYALWLRLALREILLSQNFVYSDSVIPKKKTYLK